MSLIDADMVVMVIPYRKYRLFFIIIITSPQFKVYFRVIIIDSKDYEL